MCTARAFSRSSTIGGGGRHTFDRGWALEGGASHVGIYVGDGLFMHAASRGGEVRVDGLDESYYRSRYLGARRLRGTES